MSIKTLQQTAAAMLVSRDIKALSAAAAAELFRYAARSPFDVVGGLSCPTSKSCGSGGKR